MAGMRATLPGKQSTQDQPSAARTVTTIRHLITLPPSSPNPTPLRILKATFWCHPLGRQRVRAVSIRLSLRRTFKCFGGIASVRSFAHGVLQQHKARRNLLVVFPLSAADILPRIRSHALQRELPPFHLPSSLVCTAAARRLLLHFACPEICFIRHNRPAGVYQLVVLSICFSILPALLLICPRAGPILRLLF